MALIPQKVFLTRGVGRHKEQLTSFEMALRNAQVAPFNLVTVSSIFPPFCKVVSRKHGLGLLKHGQIIFCVMSRNETNEAHRLISASVGLAIPTDKSTHGYLSESHNFGKKEKDAGDYAEDLAASMLATTLGVSFNPEASWNEKKETWKISDQIVRTCNITQSSVGVGGLWTTVLALAIFAGLNGE